MHKNSRWFMPVVVASLIFVIGCAHTQQATLHVLHVPSAIPGQQVNPSGLQAARIGISEIRIPKHLDRPAILTQASETELAYSDFQRWAAPLADELRRAITLHMAQQLDSDKVGAYGTRGVSEPDYSVRIQILAMTGTLGKEAILSAKWELSAAQTGSTQSHWTSYRAVLNGKDYRVYVEAQSKLIADFSRDIAKALQALASKTKRP